MEVLILFVFVGVQPIAIQEFNALKECALMGQQIIQLNADTTLITVRTACYSNTGEKKWDSDLQ